MAQKISLEPFLSQADQKGLLLFSVQVHQEGREDAAFYWEKYNGVHWRDNLYSVSKSIASLGLGLAIEEGILSLDDRPIDFFGELVDGTPSPLWQEMTLRHLLTLSEGFAYSTPSMGWASYERDAIPHWTKAAMNIPVGTKPGTVFHYNNVSPYLASAMFTKKSGQRLVEYMRPRVFEPLGIMNPQWASSPEGCDAGAGGLQLSPDELLRIGRLFLNEGAWQGKQLVPAAWIREATAAQITQQKPPQLAAVPGTQGSEDFWAGYGYFIWVNANGRGYRAIGNGNQLILVLPEKRAVVTVTAQDSHSQTAFMDTIWDTIYPQL